ncbi:HAMP domain-containing sensor histidine kinase [Pedobacter sp. MC2016-05]|uniref:HAMP domain-containing sensor histidine kinase n=1 Tax=Pedobacter sp. MC2016-05 TaxID=2994474 RepID=UPI0022457506|nr:HAMP domain-containing sensor histidine kinase [Pedobacter sp. MC2016-05]MCX2475015.1 HAMP domain-containing sensor histidine kinase [Pedobacter sp. MC2016-05]
MKIKDRIALYFTLISTSLLFAVLCVVYFTFMKFLQADFFERLTDRTMVTAKLYLEADEISRDALNEVRHKYLQKLNGEVTRIYDYKNRATFIGDSAQYWTKATIEKVRKNKRLKYTDGERQVVGIYYKDNQGDFVILASATDQGSHDRLVKLLKIMFFVFVMISIIVLLLSRWIAEKMLQPLKKFMTEVKQIGLKNMEFRVEERNTEDEISLIAKNFNQLMNELEQAFILQKTFVANASHELRTPVTRMMMAAELALSKERDSDSYQKAIQSMLYDAEKMDHIITGLLALAKMDVELIQSQLSLVRVDELLIKIQQEWQQQKNLEIEIINNLASKKPQVLANIVLLQMVFDNIISNGFKFSDNKKVTCILERNAKNLVVEISDQGKGISALEQEEVFKPFYTRSKELGKTGEGMGLYMAQKIIHLFKGKIEISSSSTQKSAFIIILPLF